MEKLKALDDVEKVSLYAHAAVDDLTNGNLLAARMNLMAICRVNLSDLKDGASSITGNGDDRGFSSTASADIASAGSHRSSCGDHA